jgi:sodium-dependent phosphate cotransporter
MTSSNRFLQDVAAPKSWYDHTWLKVLGTIGLVYLFLLAMSLLGASFKLAGKGLAESLFQATENPIAGLVIGILTTSLVQSSSVTTSLIVGLVGSGALPFQSAIPMVMGANIGTTITNTLISIGHLSRQDEFRRAFAGSTVHDFFNISAVIVLLPLQVKWDLIGRSAHIAESFFHGFGGTKFSSPIKLITQPVSHWLISITGDSAWISALMAVILLFIALRYIVKLLKSLVLSKVEQFFQRFIFRNSALSFVFGIGLTVLVQSSSITTSLVVPLLGAGVLTLSQVYPYQLGANIGTTITAFLASFAVGAPEAISIAFAHLIFNVYGIAIFWPLKRIPIWMAQTLTKYAMKSKFVPIAYIVGTFFVIPGILFYIME